VESSNIDGLLANVRAHIPALHSSGEVSDASRQLAAEIELALARYLVTSGRFDAAAEALTRADASTTGLQPRAEIGRQLLLLAKAWSRQAGDPDSQAKAERALQQAAGLLPAQAVPARAQHLQRLRRHEEAIAAWLDAIRLNPQEAGPYLNLARLYRQQGRPQQSLATYLDLIDAVPSPTTYLLLAERLDELAPDLPEVDPSRRLRIALLGNATLDHLESYLKVECWRAGFQPTVYQAGFDQYTQEILNPGSGLYAFAPDIVICAVHASRLFPTLHDYPFDLSVDERRASIEAGVQNVQRLFDAFSERSAALLLFHNMVAPQHPALGIADLRDEFGQEAIFGEINVRLATLARRYPGIYILDEERIQAQCGKARATDPRLWLSARMGWGDAVLQGLAREYLRFFKPYRALNRKCLVLDLDDTLWGGIVGEDGVHGIQIGSEAPGNAFLAFQRELLRLWKRGILLAVCSKNNPADVDAVFDQHEDMLLRRSHFAAMYVNWEPKPQNMRAIATELNIGLDSLVFVDDNPAERARMRAELPEVFTPELPADPADYRSFLLGLDVFESLALTDEDRRRNEVYAQQRDRQAFAESKPEGAALDGYLAGLEMVVDVFPADSASFARIAQLTNKTNQFNLTTRRYSEGQLMALLARGYRVYGMRVTDRFGDNGVVGVAILAPASADRWEVDTLLLSCRVMGRNVETALLSVLAEQARERGARSLRGWYLPTAKNAPARDCYERHGFRLVGTNDEGGELWEFDLITASLAAPDYLKLRVSPSRSDPVPV
jgi:FkbH-like protein